MYRVDTDSTVSAQLDELPIEALAAYCELLDVLEVTPWNGEPINQANPTGAVRQLVFGAHGEGMVTYLVVEHLQRVDVLHLTWVG